MLVIYKFELKVDIFVVMIVVLGIFGFNLGVRLKKLFMYFKIILIV